MSINELGRATRYYDHGSPFTESYDVDANGNTIYIGRTKPGNAKSDAKWQIIKLTYNANNLPTDRQWANAENSFRFVWDDRTTYTYS